MMRLFRRALLILGACVGLSTTALGTAHISETGSTLLYPIMTAWIEQYMKTDDTVRIDANATGSGVGISSAISGFAQIGGSDAFLSDAQMKTQKLLNIPVAVSAQEIVYNVPELRDVPPLHLSGPVLAGIYSGTIATWDALEIAALNPSVALPHHVILPVRRSDSAGDTLIFTQYLSLTTPSWDRDVHYGTGVHWPTNKKMLQGPGNAGVLVTAKSAPYSIAYLGISYAARAAASGLVAAALQNKAGAFVLPTTENTRATAEAVANLVPDDGRSSMIYTAGVDAYPLVNFEYAVVRAEQVTPGNAKALRDFLSWIVSPTEGNEATLLASVHFAPLPDRVRSIAEKQIGDITGP
jgi:phosphate transport system substrate-binding protein